VHYSPVIDGGAALFRLTALNIYIFLFSGSFTGRNWSNFVLDKKLLILKLVIVKVLDAKWKPVPTVSVHGGSKHRDSAIFMSLNVENTASLFHVKTM
jgi:hypothetical protein